jgi:hypothetical protein
MRERLEAPGEPVRRPRSGELLRHPRIRLGAVVALAVAAGIIAWAVVDRGGSSSKPSTRTSSAAARGTGPIGLTPAGLRAESRLLRQPIYWAGPKVGYTYELTRTPNRNLYVRYLPPGVRVGARGAGYLIIATYPFTRAFRGLKAVSKGHAISIPGRGIAVVDQGYPKSVHVAFRNVNYQLEVYDPSPKQSLAVATSGDIRPVR